MKTILTASRLALARMCPGAFSLPSYGEAPGEASERGTAIHAFLAMALTTSRDSALEMITDRDWRATCAGIDLQALADHLGSGGGLRTEVGVAWNPASDTGAFLGDRVGRDAYRQVDPSMIAGTIDAIGVGVMQSGDLVIADWKTGFSFIEHPATNPQIRFYALAAARAARARRVRALVVKLDEEGAWQSFEVTFGEMDLEEIAAEVRHAIGQIKLASLEVATGGIPKLTVSALCRYCPAFAGCPAQAGAAQALVALEARRVPLSPQDAGAAWALMKAVEIAVARMKAALQAQAEIEPLVLPNGKVLRPIEFDVESLDLGTAIELAPALGIGTDGLLAEATLTKAALERAAGANRAKDLVGRMREAGGVRVAKRKQFREVKAGRRNRQRCLSRTHTRPPRGINLTWRTR